MAATQATDASAAVVAVEEPECHLHPNLHAPLADHLCMLVRKNKNVRYIIETHSENLLLATQIAIARKEIDPSQVIVYWARQLPDGRSFLNPVVFDEAGRPSGDWPRNVFKEDLANAKVLFELQNQGWRNASSST
jgi:predicted ATPase